MSRPEQAAREGHFLDSAWILGIKRDALFCQSVRRSDESNTQHSSATPEAKMLNLWLVVLLGFVASARGGGGSYTCTSHKAVEDGFKAACKKNVKHVPSTLDIPNVPDGVAGLKGLTDIKIVNVDVDSLKLGGDLQSVSVSVTVTISSKGVVSIQLRVNIDASLDWDISPNGHPKVDSGKVDISISLASSSSVIPAPLWSPLHAACEPFFKVHFGACFDGVLRLVNKGLEYSGRDHNALLRSVVTDVSAAAGGLWTNHKTVNKTGDEVPYPIGPDPPPYTDGSYWSTSWNSDQLKYLWDQSPKTQTSKWPVSLLQKYFGSGVNLGPHVSVKHSLGDVRSFNIKSDGIHIQADASLEFSSGSESGDRLLLITISVDVLANLKGLGGGVDFAFQSIRPSINAGINVTSKHDKCACDNIKEDLKIDIGVIIDIDLRDCKPPFLYSPGVPSDIADKSDPVFTYQPGVGDKSFCTLEYLRPIY